MVDADDLFLAAKRVGDPLSGTLRVGIIPTISPYLLPSVTPVLRKHFSALRVAWLEDKTEVLVRRLAEGGLEAAILALEADIGDLERAIIAKDPFMVVVRREHALAQLKGPVAASDLKATSCCCSTRGTAFAIRHSSSVRRHGHMKPSFARRASRRWCRWLRGAPVSRCCRLSRYLPR